MHPARKKGILFIVIGVCISLFSLPFLSGYRSDKGFVDNLFAVGIDLKKPGPSEGAGSAAKGAGGKDGGITGVFSKFTPKRIPFRIFLVFTVILVYMGIIKIEQSRRKNSDQ